jgi:hypothetical protein
MKQVITDGKVIAGFAYAYKKHPDAPERMLMETFSRTQSKAKVKIKNHSKFKYCPDLEKYRLFSVHLKVMREMDMNLTPHDELGLPELEDDDFPEEPVIKTINGRLILEDAFDLKNPITSRRRGK